MWKEAWKLFTERRPKSVLRGDIAHDIVRLAAVMARADGVVVPEEEDRIRSHARKYLTTFTTEDDRRIRSALDVLGTSDLDVHSLASRLLPRLSENERQELMEHIFAVAMADGYLHAAEERLLTEIGNDLQIDKSYFSALLNFCRATSKPRRHSPSPPSDSRVSDVPLSSDRSTSGVPSDRQEEPPLRAGHNQESTTRNCNAVWPALGRRGQRGNHVVRDSTPPRLKEEHARSLPERSPVDAILSLLLPN